MLSDVIHVLFIIISITLSDKTEVNHQRLKHNGDQSDGCMKAPFCSCPAVCLSAEGTCSIASPPHSLPLFIHLSWPSLTDGSRRERTPPIRSSKVVLLQQTQARDAKTVVTTPHFSPR